MPKSDGNPQSMGDGYLAVAFGSDECALQPPPSRLLAKHGCGFKDRGHDRRVTRAPADMAGKHIADLLLVRLGSVPQKMRHGT
jgi:hypothetical protein